MEIGVGIHGEPGRRRSKLSSADAIAEEMLSAILSDLAPPASSECLLLVNGFGGTPLMELYLMVNAARRILAGRGLAVTRYLTGSLVTSLDMAGCSLTVTLLDVRLTRAVGRSGQDRRAVLVERRPERRSDRSGSLPPWPLSDAHPRPLSRPAFDHFI